MSEGVFHTSLTRRDRARLKFFTKVKRPIDDLATVARDALETYADDVRSGAFPEEQHTYSIPDEELALFEESVPAR